MNKIETAPVGQPLLLKVLLSDETQVVIVGYLKKETKERAVYDVPKRQERFLAPLHSHIEKFEAIGLAELSTYSATSHDENERYITELLGWWPLPEGCEPDLGTAKVVSFFPS